MSQEKFQKTTIQKYTNMQYWNQIPLFRLILPFILGILLSIFVRLPNFNLLTLLIFCLLILSILVKHYSKRWMFGMFSYILFFLFGILIIQSKHYISKDNYFTNFESEYFEVKLLEDVVRKPNSYKSEVQVLSCYNSEGEEIETEGKAIIYFKVDSFSRSLEYGDHILIKSAWEPVIGPTNPAQFNYKEFLKNKGIFHQTYLTKKKWKSENKNSGFSIKRYSLNLREISLNMLKKFGFKDEVLSVSSALLLGDKDLLARETVLMYSSSGAMHVLAVSGLHVGIIFLAFSYLFFFLEKMKYGRYIKAFLLILILWGYALFTGMSASVLRAATMFSFVIIGGILNRRTNIYNTLAASAFLLLIIDPLIIMQVGFQLSYIAVIGIVYLQPKIYKLFYFSNWFIDKIWIISSVSIAAQIATFPLGMYYFHQYPNYFLLSNLFVIPLATLILNLSLMMFFTSVFPLISESIGSVVRLLVELLNSSIGWVNQLPYSLNLGIDISFFETLLIYIFITIFLISVINKRFKHIKLSILLMIVFMSFQIREMNSTYKQKKIIFYDIPKGTAIDFVDGVDCYFYATDWIVNDKSKIRFNILHNRWEINIENVVRIIDEFDSDNLKLADNYIQFFENDICFLENKNYQPSSSNHKINLLLVEKGTSENLISFLDNFKVDKVIFTTLTTNKERYKMKKVCLEKNISFHDIKVDGSFEFFIT